MWYTVGANTYANSDVSLSLGDGLGSLFGDVFTGRTWNGTINYTAVPTPEPASFILWGIGLAGLFGRQYKSARR
jgi:hypothetical protein